MIQIVVSGVIALVIAAFLYGARSRSRKKGAKQGRGLVVVLSVALVVAIIGIVSGVLKQSVSRYDGISAVVQMEQRSPKYAALKTYFPQEYQAAVAPAVLARTPEEQSAALATVNPALERIVMRQFRFADSNVAGRYVDLLGRVGSALAEGDARRCVNFYATGSWADASALLGPEIIGERERILGDLVAQTATSPAELPRTALEAVAQRVNQGALGSMSREEIAQLQPFLNTGAVPSDQAGVSALCRYMTNRFVSAANLPPADKAAFLQALSLTE